MNWILLLAEWYLDYLAGKPQAIRSPKWRDVRKEHLLIEPSCRVCGTAYRLSVHHKKPYHLFPELELDPNNLMTLCERNGCHFMYGHCRHWKAYNPSIELDVVRAYVMILNRKRTK